MSDYRLEMHNVVKTFPGVKALDGAQDVYKRQVPDIIESAFAAEKKTAVF